MHAGADEGAFAWLTLNYLLGHLGKEAGQTVAAIDLGGGSVQQAFAIPEADVAGAPDGYITQLSGGGRTYHVYVHRWGGGGPACAGGGNVVPTPSNTPACSAPGMLATSACQATITTRAWARARAAGRRPGRPMRACAAQPHEEGLPRWGQFRPSGGAACAATWASG